MFLYSVCSNGTYGPDCNSVCSGNCVNGKCDRIYGTCTDGCVPGYTGRACNYECNQGTYGPNCSISCSAKCINRRCDATDGSCMKGCVSGYTGTFCNKACSIDFYGDGCLKRCGQCRGPCEATTGNCLFGCMPGYHGKQCMEGNPSHGHLQRQLERYRKRMTEIKRKMSDTTLDDYNILQYNYQYFWTVYYYLQYYISYVLPGAQLESHPLGDS